MKKEYWVMVVVVILLLGAAFVVGLVLVKPSEKSLVVSLPVVGKWMADRRAMNKPVVDERVLLTFQPDL